MRYAVFNRKDGGQPTEATAVEASLPETEDAEGLTCPECGLALVDTPEARDYLAAKAAGADALGEDAAEDAGDVDEEAL